MCRLQGLISRIWRSGNQDFRWSRRRRVGGPQIQDQWQSMLEREARLQAGLRHRNIVKTLSFCSTLEFKALILEYMPHGSLDDHLHPRVLDGNRGKQQVEALGQAIHKCDLPWNSRLCVAVDVAEGLTYLHYDNPQPLIHGDLKPSNILLDDKMVAKVADFGISKLVNPPRGDFGHGEATVSSIHGTVGYMPPEYAYVTTVSTNGDVYSYGVILLEMLSGSPPSDAGVPLETDYKT